MGDSYFEYLTSDTLSWVLVYLTPCDDGFKFLKDMFPPDYNWGSIIFRKFTYLRLLCYNEGDPNYCSDNLELDEATFENLSFIEYNYGILDTKSPITIPLRREIVGNLLKCRLNGTSEDILGLMYILSFLKLKRDYPHMYEKLGQTKFDLAPNEISHFYNFLYYVTKVLTDPYIKHMNYIMNYIITGKWDGSHILRKSEMDSLWRILIWIRDRIESNSKINFFRESLDYYSTIILFIMLEPNFNRQTPDIVDLCTEVIRYLKSENQLDSLKLFERSYSDVIPQISSDDEEFMD